MLQCQSSNRRFDLLTQRASTPIRCTGGYIVQCRSSVRDKSARTITVDQCKKALEELSAKRFPKDDDGKNKTFALIAGKKPGTTGVTKASKTGGVDRMTDTSQYTGSHKERFGADGKGKGIEGREDIADNSGYVGNYKGEKTYDKK
ncbi:TPPP3 [Branchiostoma lanceolatum]|uniref:TPPP3 protein n=1 Tax=Branchiostoma lanceolatum TaxID=7740 RepID=A0A8K0A5C3_BRALA|nr:TPPP3 [Branchiostoma lanceolatum]